MKALLKHSNALAIAAIIGMALWSFLGFVYMIRDSLSASGSIDFHSYWYSGHFVRQGTDPYEAFLSEQQPQIPVYYLDGKAVTAQPVAQPGLAIVPANTAPIVLLLSLFSFFSWPLAKSVWLIVNLLLALMIPWMVLRLWFPNAGIRSESLIIVFSFWSLLATRMAVITGQTTLVVFALMLLTLMTMNKNWVLSGIALGIALSKYSLSMPVLLFLLFKRKSNVIALALAAQAIGLLGLSILTNVSPMQVWHEYILMIGGHLGDKGIHLVYSIYRLMPDAISTPVFFSITLLSTFIVGAPLAYWLKRYYFSLPDNVRSLADFHIVTILMLWTLLVVYHREYDVVIWIVFVAFVIYGVRANVWQLSREWRRGLTLFLAFSMLWLSRPQQMLATLLPDQVFRVWEQAGQTLVTLILMACLTVTFILLYRIPSLQVYRSACQYG